MACVRLVRPPHAGTVWGRVDTSTLPGGEGDVRAGAAGAVDWRQRAVPWAVAVRQARAAKLGNSDRPPYAMTRSTCAAWLSTASGKFGDATPAADGTGTADPLSSHGAVQLAAAASGTASSAMRPSRTARTNMASQVRGGGGDPVSDRGHATEPVRRPGAMPDPGCRAVSCQPSALRRSQRPVGKSAPLVGRCQHDVVVSGLLRFKPHRRARDASLGRPAERGREGVGGIPQSRLLSVQVRVAAG